MASRALAGPAPMADGDEAPAAAPTPALKPQSAARAQAETKVASKTVTYRVKSGDTLFGIAQLFDTTVAKIKSLNRLTSNRIKPGLRLKIAAS
jgi:LysM repeat protein